MNSSSIKILDHFFYEGDIYYTIIESINEYSPTETKNVPSNFFVNNQTILLNYWKDYYEKQNEDEENCKQNVNPPNSEDIQKIIKLKNQISDLEEKHFSLTKQIAKKQEDLDKIIKITANETSKLTEIIQDMNEQTKKEAQIQKENQIKTQVEKEKSKDQNQPLVRHLNEQRKDGNQKQEIIEQNQSNNELINQEKQNMQIKQDNKDENFRETKESQNKEETISQNEEFQTQNQQKILSNDNQDFTNETNDDLEEFKQLQTNVEEKIKNMSEADMTEAREWLFRVQQATLLEDSNSFFEHLNDYMSQPFQPIYGTVQRKHSEDETPYLILTSNAQPDKKVLVADSLVSDLFKNIQKEGILKESKEIFNDDS